MSIAKPKMIARHWTVFLGVFPDGDSAWVLVFPHPTKPDKVRKTSPIVCSNNNLVFTESGSCYQVDPDTPSLLYKNVLQTLGLVYDPSNPIPETFWLKEDHGQPDPKAMDVDPQSDPQS